MAFRLLSSTDTVLVYGTTVTDALSCTIATTPSGSIVLRTIPRASFEADLGHALLSSLADAVENIIGEGTAIAASGFQGVDAAGFLADYVRFTVGYTPSGGTPGEITADVDIPVNVLTADTQFGSFLDGGSAAQRIADTYSRLQAMSSG